MGIVNPKIKLQWLAEQQIENPTPGCDYVKEAQELSFKALECPEVNNRIASGLFDKSYQSFQACLRSLDCQIVEGQECTTAGQVSAHNEGKSYLADMYSEMDSLGFWQWNAQWFFSTLRMCLLFSKAEKDRFVQPVVPRMMEACMIIKGSYQTEGPLDFTSHFKHQPMLEELELMTTKDDEMP
ncbi:hypothetical protein AAF712_014469 [Marasmius tenuissimus]|uniref:Uncharacterized protein n=1 Tax=Marasmius tenuissimus TaxID=585030 RepID=A0ABR2ZEI3_9AGAR